MKGTTILPFITVTSSLWLHLRTCLIKMKCCIKKNVNQFMLPVVQEIFFNQKPKWDNKIEDTTRGPGA